MNFKQHIPEQVRRVAEHVEVRVAGGAVRDLLMGIEPKDWDLATPVRPEEVVRRAEAAGFHVIPTGLQHGTVTVVVEGMPLEITTLRVDVECDGRHAEVEFTDSWEADSSRRDLSFNSLFLDMDGIVHDFHGGVADLEARRVRFVGDPGERLAEDRLRLLRAFRFMGRMRNVRNDCPCLGAMREHAPGLEEISGERIADEMRKIIGGWNPSMILAQMKLTGVFRHIGLPENLDLTRLGEVAKFTQNPITRLVAGVMVFESPWVSEELLETLTERWKVSKEERELARFLVAETEIERDFSLREFQGMVFINGIRKDWVIELALLQRKPVEAEALANWTTPVLPVTGDDLLDMGIEPGPKVGEVLRVLKLRWFHRDFEDSREAILGWAEEVIARFYS